MAQSKNRPIPPRAMSMHIPSRNSEKDGSLMRHRRSLLTGATILPAAISMLLVSPTAHAANINFTGGGSWFTAKNWQVQPAGGNFVPGAGDNAFIYGPGPIIDAPGAIANKLTVTGSNGSFSITAGGSLTVRGETILGNGGDTYGTATVSGPGALWTADRITFGNIRGVGSATVSNGGRVVADTTILSPFSSLTVTGAGSEWKSGNTIMDIGSKTIVSDGGSIVLTSFASMWQRSSLFIGGGSADAADAKAPGLFSTTARPVAMSGGSVIYFNHTDQTRTYQFTPVLTGEGTLEFVNGATVLTANSRAFTGATNIREQGTLVVKGSLSGSNVSVWGVLAGNGDVGSATINGNGKIEPGNSIGTLHIRNNFFMTPDSVYRAEISGTASDLIEVGGRADIQSETIEIVRDTASTSPLLPGTQYTLITAAGGLTVGAPQRAIADFPFLTLTLSNDANNGYLTLSRSPEAFATLATTPNEFAVASAIDAAGVSSPLWQEIVGAGEAQAEAAFSSLAGASFQASVPAMLSAQSYQLRDAVLGRLQGLGNSVIGAVASTGNALAYVPTQGVGTNPLKAIPAPSERADDRVVGVWMQGLGSWGRLDGNSNVAGIKQSSGGVISGADVTFDGEWRLGVAGGYSYSQFDALDDSASASSDNYHLALYGGGQIGAWGLRGGASYSWHDGSASRQVVAVNLFNQLSSDNTATTGQVFGEVGYSFAMSERVMLEPFANLAYVSVDSGGITETGGPAGVSGSTSFDTTYSTLGLRGVMTVAQGLTVRGTLGWRHAMGDITPVADLAFVSGGSPFALAGAPIARDAFVTEAGFDYAVGPNASMGLVYSGQFANEAYDNSIKASLRWQF